MPVVLRDLGANPPSHLDQATIGAFAGISSSIVNGALSFGDIAALIDAAQNGKAVTAVVELKALRLRGTVTIPRGAPGEGVVSLGTIELL